MSSSGPLDDSEDNLEHVYDSLIDLEGDVEDLNDAQIRNALRSADAAIADSYDTIEDAIDYIKADLKRYKRREFLKTTGAAAGGLLGGGLLVSAIPGLTGDGYRETIRERDSILEVANELERTDDVKMKNIGISIQDNLDEDPNSEYSLRLFDGVNHEILSDYTPLRPDRLELQNEGDLEASYNLQGIYSEVESEVSEALG